jgi:hypothetical protein
VDNDHAPEAVELLREQLRTLHSDLESLDRKLALVVPVLAGVAALVPPWAGAGWPANLLIAGYAVAALAAGLSLLGLVTRRVRIGPNARLLAWQVRTSYPDYYRHVAQALQESIVFNAALADQKARRFNQAAVTASCAILLIFAARLLEAR